MRGLLIATAWCLMAAAGVACIGQEVASWQEELFGRVNYALSSLPD
jgi:hypothetical protein